MMQRLMLAALLLLAVSVSTSSRAATLDINAGQLLGASNVRVGGNLYDVVFTDGTCISLFSGCDGPSDFAFTTEAAGLAAATALSEQVFLDGPEGNFDTLPGLTFGCGSPSVCGVYIPYATNGTTLLAARMENRAPPGTDRLDVNRLLGLSHTLSSNSATYAVFTAAPIPEPGSSILFGLGLGLVGFAAKRSRRAAP
jgi:hypothetical protein